MPPATKRPAANVAATSGSAPKRKATEAEDPVVLKCAAIEEAVRSAEGFSKSTLAMVATGVRTSLALPKEERHVFQEDVVRMIKDVLASKEADALAEMARLHRIINEADSKKDVLAAAVEFAATAEVETTAGLEAAEGNLAVAAVAVAQAKSAQADAYAAQEAGDKQYRALQDQKNRLDHVIREEFAALRDGKCDNPADLFSIVAKIGGECGLDDGLLLAGESALCKPLAERAAFDATVIEQVGDELSKAAMALEERIGAEAPGVAERAATVESTGDEVAAAQDCEKTRKEELRAAQGRLREARANKRTAEKAVKDFGPEMKRNYAALAVARGLVQERQSTLSFFNELANRTVRVAPEAEVANDSGEDHRATDTIGMPVVAF